MFKRVVWFAVGATAGVVGLRRAEQVVAERRARLAPDSLANTAADAANRGATRVRSALHDGRSEMRRVADELEATHGPARKPDRSRRDPTPG